MKKSAFLIIALVFASGSLRADNQWQKPPSEAVYTYEDGDNWTMGFGAYVTDPPRTESNYACASFNKLSSAEVAGTTKIRFTADHTVTTFRNFRAGSEGNPAVYDFDLNKTTLDVSYTGESFFITGGGTCLSKDDLGLSDMTVILRNGTVNMKGSLAFGRADQKGGGLVLTDGAQLTGKMGNYFGSPRFKIEKGAVFTASTGFAQGDLTAGAMTDAYGYICVTGENTSATFGDAKIGGNHMRLMALDGGSLTVNALALANKADSDDVRLIVDGGSVYSANWSLSVGAQLDGSSNPRVVIGADPRSLLRAKTCNVVQGKNAVLEWRVPADGWTDGEGVARAPFQCYNANFTVAPLADNLTDYGDLKAEVRALDWMKRHPGATVVLLSTVADSTDGFNILKESARVTDFDSRYFEGEPVFAVSADGKSFTLTAPAAKPSPAVFTIASDVGSAADGPRTLKVSFADWGQWATSITQLRLFYGQKPDYSDAMQVALPVTGLSGEVPLEKVFADVLPAHDPDKTYFCTVTAINDQGLSSSVEIIEDAGVAEWFRWTNAVSGDFYDLANWEVGETGSSGNGPWFAATHFPRGEDSVRLPDGYGAFTISAARDVEIGWIRNWTCDADMSHLHHCTFDMNGHALRLCGHNSNSVMDAFGYKAQAFDLSLPSACYAFKNAAIDNSYKWFMQGSYGDTTSSGITLKNGAKTVYQCLGFNNGSTLRVESGSTLTMTNTAVQFSTSRARSTTGYGYVLVKDAGSSIKAATSGFTFGVSGCNMGLYVLEGGRMDADTLILGFGSALYSGAPESVENNHDCFGLVSNATLTAATFRLGNNKEQVRAPKLTLAGTNTLVKVSGTFYNYRGTGAEFAFDLSADGFRDDAGNLRAPFVANALSSVSRGSFTDYGATKLRINYKAAMDTLGGETVPLMTLATANAEGLQELADNVVYDRTVPTGCGVSVSQDGKTLLMTVPKRTGLMLIVR